MTPSFPDRRSSDLVYLLFVHDLGANPVRLGPFFDLVLARNTGISYGLFQTDGALGQWLLLALKAVAVVFLWVWLARAENRLRSEEHTSELQSLMRISYAVFCLKKKTNQQQD